MRGQEALRFAQCAFDRISDAAFWVRADARFVYVNDAACRLVGYSRDELMTMSMFDLNSDFPAEDWPDHWRDVCGRGVYTFESRVRAKDGRLVPAEISVSFVAFEEQEYNCTFVRDISKQKRPEEALRESEEKFRTICASAQDAIIMMNSEGAISFWNQAAQQTFGYTPEEAMGKNVYTLLAPERFQEAHLQAFPRFQETGQGAAVGKTIGLTGVRKSGEEFPLELSLSAVRIQKQWHAIGILRDITEGERSEQALQLTHYSVDRAADAVFWIGSDGRFAYVNQAACRALGYSREELAGMTVHDIDPDFPEHGWSDHWNEVRRRKSFTIESRHRHKNGRTFPVEIVINHLEFGDKEFICAFARDVTNRKQAEKELRQAHAGIRGLLESIPSILIGLNENDNITAWNAAAEKTFGIAEKDAVGQSVDDCGIRWDVGPIRRIISECRTHGRPTRQYEARFTCPDGREAFLGFTASPMGSDGNRTGNVLIIAADVTEKRILESQFAQTQKLESIGRLAAGIAHEINTPTQFVGDNTRFLQDAFADLRRLLGEYGRLTQACRTGPVTPEVLADVAQAEKDVELEYLIMEIPQAIAQSLEGVERVSRIVRAMKDFSHPGTEGREAVDLNKAIESTVTVARNEWKYVADMVTDFDPALPPVPCQVNEFNQVILNIVINAAHAIGDVVGKNTGRKGTITISTRRDGDWGEIRIGDTGTGILEEHRSKIFEHFFTTKEVGTGTGQGLAMAHAVINDKHGGTLTFETETGRGTTFVIRLPIDPEPGAAGEIPHREEAHSLR